MTAEKFVEIRKKTDEITSRIHIIQEKIAAIETQLRLKPLKLRYLVDDSYKKEIEDMIAKYPKALEIDNSYDIICWNNRLLRYKVFDYSILMNFNVQLLSSDAAKIVKTGIILDYVPEIKPTYLEEELQLAKNDLNEMYNGQRHDFVYNLIALFISHGFTEDEAKIRIKQRWHEYRDAEDEHKIKALETLLIK